MPCRESMLAVVDQAHRCGLVSEEEKAAMVRLFEPCFPFVEQLRSADSIHVHVKVADTTKLPREQLRQAGGRVDHEKDGFVKFHFDAGVNLIFSSIPVSQDELAETPSSRRPRPFVDHFGIDLRAETVEANTVFEAVPTTATQLGWGHVPQGDPDRGVHCCHVEVKKKHWVYPRQCEGPPIALEFAFGQLKVNEVSGGCDLRPTDPAAKLPGSRPDLCQGKP